jgi:hypothetical protein
MIEPFCIIIERQDEVYIIINEVEINRETKIRLLHFHFNQTIDNYRNTPL